jgi:hypothetical protein
MEGAVRHTLTLAAGAGRDALSAPKMASVAAPALSPHAPHAHLNAYISICLLKHSLAPALQEHSPPAQHLVHTC